MCVWQLDGQCCRSSVQVRRDAGIVPSCASVADPENAIGSPTFHISVERGVWMIGTGGELLAVIGIVADVVEARWLSVTRSRTLYVPGWYVNLGLAAVESSKRPSPFRSHA